MVDETLAASVEGDFRPRVRRSELPLTKAVAAAIAGNSGSDVQGYRDYRGAKVVGAWTWLPEYEIGVLTEIDYDEAFRPLAILRRVFFGLFALLGLSSPARQCSTPRPSSNFASCT